MHVTHKPCDAFVSALQHLPHPLAQHLLLLQLQLQQLLHCCCPPLRALLLRCQAAAAAATGAAAAGSNSQGLVATAGAAETGPAAT
jgi:hypothetical protein